MRHESDKVVPKCTLEGAIYTSLHLKSLHHNICCISVCENCKTYLFVPRSEVRLFRNSDFLTFLNEHVNFTKFNITIYS